MGEHKEVDGMNHSHYHMESNHADYQPMHENNWNVNQQVDMKDFCKQQLYQYIQIEVNDGSTYIGILHSFDDNQLYLLIPTPDQDTNRNDANDQRLFPFFGPFGLFGFPFYGIRRFGPYRPYWWW